MSKEEGVCTVENERDISNSKKANKKHFCPYVGCTLAFDRPWKLDRHLNTHTNQRPFKCDHPGCSKGYTNNSHLKRHKIVSHSINKPLPKSIPCEFSECKRIFASRWSMKRHFPSHFTEIPIRTVKLKRSLETKCDTIHDDCPHCEADIICPTCKKSFRTSKDLANHKKKHKIYCCDHTGCSEKFTSWNNLRTHSKLSHAERYQCDFCKNFYKNKWTLTEHVLSHLPLHERDVILCPFSNCGRHYFYERNLEAHIKSYHHKINYKCEVQDCGKLFTTKQKLNEHVIRHTKPTVRKKRKKLTQEEKRIRREKNPKKKSKSMAAKLSGLVLPPHIEKSIARDNITSEVLDYIEKIKNGKPDVLEKCDKILSDELHE